MFLSDRDLIWAIRHGLLIVDPAPEEGSKDLGPTSIDLHLDRIEEAKVWNLAKFRQRTALHGGQPLLHLGSFKYKDFAEYQTVPGEDSSDLVYQDGKRIIVKPGGFLLWQTKEKVGTPEQGAQLICFVDGKSTLARTGLIVHMTAPTIHAGWGAWNVTLEIANLGPFHFVLQEGDAIAQITAAQISSIPMRTMRASGSLTVGQSSVGITPSS
jgi:dCTP deaminase